MTKTYNPLEIDTTQYVCANVFVDLEGVLIESWDDWQPLLFNKGKVNYWSNLDSFDMPLIFSNAIDNVKDNCIANTRIMYIEAAFEQGFYAQSDCCVEQRNTKRLPMWEYKQQGKRQNFIDYVKSLDNNEWNNNLFVLLDDTVNHEFLRFDNFDILFVKV